VRLPYYSNPNVRIDGTALGDASTSYNACVIQQLSRYVSNFWEVANADLAHVKVTVAETCPHDLASIRNLCTGGTFTSTAALEVLEGCHAVDADLVLDGASVDDLSALATLEVVHGGLTIEGVSVETLTGLEALQHVEGDLVIEDNGSLTSTEALSSLVVVEDLSVQDNDVLVTLELASVVELGEVVVDNNEDLTDIRFDALAILNDLVLWSNNTLTTLSLGTVDRVEGQLWIENNDDLESLEAFAGIVYVGGDLGVNNHAELLSLDMSMLGEVGGLIQVRDNPKLTDCSLDALDEDQVSVADVGNNGTGCAL